MCSVIAKGCEKSDSASDLVGLPVLPVPDRPDGQERARRARCRVRRTDELGRYGCWICYLGTPSTRLLARFPFFTVVGLSLT